MPVGAVRPGSTSAAMPVVAASAYKPLEQPVVAAHRLSPSPAACQCWEGKPLAVVPSPRLREAATSRPQSAAMQGRTLRRVRCSAPASSGSSGAAAAVQKGRPPQAATTIPVSPAYLAASLQGPKLSPWSARPRPRSPSSPIASPSRPQSAAASPASPARPHSARAAPRQHCANGRRQLLASPAGDGREAAATCGPAATQLDFGGVGGGTAFLNQLDSLTERPLGFGGVCDGRGLGLATKQIAPHARSGAPSRGRPSSASSPPYRPQPPRPATRSPELPVEELRIGIVQGGGVDAAQTARIPARVPLEPEMAQRHHHREPPRRPWSARVPLAAHVELEIFPAEVGPWARDVSAPRRGAGLRATGRASPTSSSPSPFGPSPVTVPHGSWPPSRGEPMTLTVTDPAPALSQRDS